MGAADRLAGLAFRLGRDGTTVDDDGIFDPGPFGQAAHHLGFIQIEAAAETEDFEAGHQAKPARSSVPVKLVATGPVRRTCPPSVQATVSTPRSMTISALRPVSPRRAAATSAAQAPEPQAKVNPAPRH